MRAASSKNSAKSVTVIGAGGNIGSHLVPHLARMKSVVRVTLIDRDIYEESNLLSQCITPNDVAKSKARVQARILRRINPQLHLEAIKDSVESVPLGQLRANVILACLDSRCARQYVNQVAWRLGVPWIDAGVDAGGLLARVNVYVPGADNPCLECAWDERDYAALEQTYPCNGFVEQSFSTNAPSSLGALAASLQAIECRKILDGETEIAAIGKQVLIDARHHKHYVTLFKRNPRCRFANHEVWDIKRLNICPKDLTIAQALRLVDKSSPQFSASLRVEGNVFVKRLTCAHCGHAKKLLRLRSSLRASEIKCKQCGQDMLAAGIDLIEQLNAALLSPTELSRSLRSVGFRCGDVFGICHRQDESYYEIAG